METEVEDTNFCLLSSCWIDLNGFSVFVYMLKMIKLVNALSPTETLGFVYLFVCLVIGSLCTDCSGTCLCRSSRPKTQRFPCSQVPELKVCATHPAPRQAVRRKFPQTLSQGILFCFVWDSISNNLSWSQTQWVVRDEFELLTLLPLPPECKSCRHAAPCLNFIKQQSFNAYVVIKGLWETASIKYKLKTLKWRTKNGRRIAKEEGMENRVLILAVSILSYSTRKVTANLARHIHWVILAPKL